MPQAAPRSFRAPYAPDEPTLVGELLMQGGPDAAAEARIDATAIRLIEAVRSRSGPLGGVEELLHTWSLTTREGVALMVLAESLLRVPDSVTADLLIEDKIGHGHWQEQADSGDAFLVQAAAWALGFTARIIGPGESTETIVQGIARRLGVPAVRIAARQVVKLIGDHFVMGETIEDALKRASGSKGRYRFSFDMLGEGARTAHDARQYLASYDRAIEAIGTSGGGAALPARHGISVKLSALHPRYEATSNARVMAELVPVVVALAREARERQLNFTIDAEEADRLELSLDVIEAVLRDESLAGWDGFGLAIQAYQKRALAVVDWTHDLARRLDRRLMVRLVKGAYWDTEVKRAQERGLPDYPVFTRKSATDLNYIACARQLLSARPRIFPQFATHNALTVATLLEIAGDPTTWEFQRLHGMGDSLYEALLETHPSAACRIYAPVGNYRDLLAYLVRRLLENGANSSFVAQVADPDVAPAHLVRRPHERLAAALPAERRGLAPPPQLFGPSRRNSIGVELGDYAALSGLLEEISATGASPVDATSVIDGRQIRGGGIERRSPIDDHSVIGTVTFATDADANAAMAAADKGFVAWHESGPIERAACLDRLSDLLQQHRGELIALLQAEGGRTLDDCVSELREAIDFCRYYAAEARSLFATSGLLPGPTGEENRLRYRGRGVFVCISPWNFPLAIFLGQVAAALVAGNSVVAKPAEQTPLIAHRAIRLAHDAGIPASALQLVLGDGAIGARLIGHRALSGVAFTGSGEVAAIINRALAARDGPIVPLIAETGGVNVMIVDATALPEQVTDDVLTSAFRSAGQRCSALRLLCLQEDIADRCLEMIKGAVSELVVGDPRDPATHIGPVIDADARKRLDRYIASMQAAGIRPGRLGDAPLPKRGFFVAPHLFEIADADRLRTEVFGPILHVVRWRASDLDSLLTAIAASGYGLTFGVQTRIDANVERAVRRIAAGNIYVNRNMIGAVVGSQPFGGMGLSGTGPKAGGPNYLRRFALEQTISINTAAAGGNAALMATLPVD